MLLILVQGVPCGTQLVGLVHTVTLPIHFFAVKGRIAPVLRLGQVKEGRDSVEPRPATCSACERELIAFLEFTWLDLAKAVRGGIQARS